MSKAHKATLPQSHKLLCNWQRLGHQDGKAVNEEGLWVLVQVLLGMRKMLGDLIAVVAE